MERFSIIHLDLVGPLPVSEGYAYLLTIVDRFSRWMEALPLENITAITCARALLRGWIAHFGVPAQIITDQGRQFTSSLWRELSHLLGIRPSTTTAYHPQANGMVERLHRTLKERLMSRALAGTAGWMDNLPLVLLGLRTSVRQDSLCSPADVVYGSHLRLPGDLLPPASSSDLLPPASSSDAQPSAVSDFVSLLRTAMRGLSPLPVVRRSALPSLCIPGLLADCSHVFLRIDDVRRPLSPPYEGPFEVVSRSAKFFVIRRAGREVSVSMDRLKPAYMECVSPLPRAAVGPPTVASPAAQSTPDAQSTPEAQSTTSAQSTPPAARTPPAAAPVSPGRLDPDDWPLPTRYGRVPRPPDRFVA